VVVLARRSGPQRSEDTRSRAAERSEALDLNKANSSVLRHILVLRQPAQKAVKEHDLRAAVIPVGRKAFGCYGQWRAEAGSDTIREDGSPTIRRASGGQP
jgi:hypothetical protein